MKWACFLFWFAYRLFLACLAHANWIIALYTNCVYYTLWKSYDLLWFWMHLILCSCFTPLRKENYLIVWCNLIWKKRTKYPNNTFKEIYLTLYGGKGTKSERALQRMDTIEVRERESRRQRKLTIGSSSSSEDEEDTATASATNVPNRPSETVLCGAKIRPDIIEQEEEEARKYAYVGQAVDSSNDLIEDNRRNATSGEEPPPHRPPRHSRSPLTPPQVNVENADVLAPNAQYSKEGEKNGRAVSFTLADKQENPAPAEEEGSENESDTNSTSKWLQKMPNVIKNKFKKGKYNRNSNNETSENQLSIHSGNSEGSGSGLLDRFKTGMPSFPNIFNRLRSDEPVDPNAVDVLRPDYTNTYDILDETKSAKREKRDRKALTKRVRKRLREELQQAARIEKKRKKMSDAIELILMLYRMITSFAILVANFRKTSYLARFKYSKSAEDPYEITPVLDILSWTTLMDSSMFMFNFMWFYCLQWHLFCRLGFVRFWTWAAILITVGMTVMMFPMSYAMNQLDASWCFFRSNSTLAKYQPKW